MRPAPTPLGNVLLRPPCGARRHLPEPQATCEVTSTQLYAVQHLVTRAVPTPTRPSTAGGGACRPGPVTSPQAPQKPRCRHGGEVHFSPRGLGASLRQKHTFQGRPVPVYHTPVTLCRSGETAARQARGDQPGPQGNHAPHTRGHGLCQPAGNAGGNSTARRSQVSPALPEQGL